MEEGIFKLSVLAPILGCKVLIIRRQMIKEHTRGQMFFEKQPEFYYSFKLN